MVAAVASLVLAACQDPLPIPRIEASLEGWDQPYQGVDGIEIHAFRTGAVRSLEGATFAGGSWTAVVEMGAWAFVVEHPTAGLIVFDTGLSDRARTEPEHYVGWLGTQLDMIEMDEGQTLRAQMRAAGLDPADVAFVVISHLHYDHTGGISDFPNAVVVVSQAEKAWVEAGVTRTDFVDVEALGGIRGWKTIDFASEKPLATLGAAHDLTGDSSVFVVDLAGHTPGSQGLLVRAPDAAVLMTGDAAWTEQNWRWPARPVFAFDMDRWWEQAWRIRKFASLEPNLVVIPGHDDRAVAEVALESFTAHGGSEDASGTGQAAATADSVGN